MPIEVHLWDLRLTYIRGALLYNSYNWQSIGRQRVMDYMATFARSMEKTDASAELTADREGRLRIALLPDVRAANYLVAEAGLPVSEHGAVIAEVADDRGHLLAFGRAEGPFLAGDARIALRFNEAFELGKGSAASIRLYGEKSGRSLSLVRGRLSLDLMRERAQSLYTIAHAALVR